MDLLSNRFPGCQTVGHVVYPTVTGYLFIKSDLIYHASGWIHSASTFISTTNLLTIIIFKPNGHWMESIFTMPTTTVMIHLMLQLNPAYDIFRMSYPDGQAEKIVDHGFWPRISSDATKLVYVSVKPVFWIE